MKEKIQRLKKEKNAIILSHYYTLPEVQEVADFVGDSLALAQKAADTNADIILFAGVHFMAETAKILNPTKKVLIPDLYAGCSLADDCPADELEVFMKAHPGHLLISYINCSAAVKGMSDIIVTSGNALRIVKSIPEDQKIVFAPDRNLGRYINEQLGRNMVLWDGACHVHDGISPEAVQAAKEAHPNVAVIAHPECPKDVLDLADFVGSTAAMLKKVSTSSDKEFIVITENGILFELRKQNPDKTFYTVVDNLAGLCNNCINCKYMKLNNLEKIYNTLDTETPELLLTEEEMAAARKPIERMLQY